MQIVIDIPEEQIKKSLEESKYIHEDEGEKSFVNIAMQYTNAQLEFVDIERKTDFYSCKYKILPKKHGDLIDRDALRESMNGACMGVMAGSDDYDAPLKILDSATVIIEADRSEK